MFNRRWKKLAWAATAMLIVAALALPSARGADPSGNVRDTFRSGTTVVISADQTVSHDLYLAGSTVQVDGHIEGDLFVAGGTINVTGPAARDLYATRIWLRISAAVS